MPQDNDRALIERILAGHQDAKEELATRLYPMVRRVVGARLKGCAWELREEVIQQTLLKLFEDDMRALRAFRGDDIGPYVRKIAVNNCNRALRKLPRNDAPLPEDDGPETPVRDPRPNPEFQLLADENRHRIDEAMQHLTNAEGQAIRLLYFEDVDFAAVANELGVTRNNLAQIHFRALKKLLAALGRHPELEVWLQEDRRRVEVALQDLSDPERDVITLLYMERCDLGTVAERLGLPEGEVVQIHSRALVKLRAALGGDGEDGGR